MTSPSDSALTGPVGPWLTSPSDSELTDPMTASNNLVQLCCENPLWAAERIALLEAENDISNKAILLLDDLRRGKTESCLCERRTSKCDCGMKAIDELLQCVGFFPE